MRVGHLPAVRTLAAVQAPEEDRATVAPDPGLVAPKDVTIEPVPHNRPRQNDFQFCKLNLTLVRARRRKEQRWLTSVSPLMGLASPMPKPSLWTLSQILGSGTEFLGFPCNRPKRGRASGSEVSVTLARQVSGRGGQRTGQAERRRLNAVGTTRFRGVGVGEGPAASGMVDEARMTPRAFSRPYRRGSMKGPSHGRLDRSGRLAQLGERRVRNAEVGSSSLLPSTK